MGNTNLADWVARPVNTKILSSFSIPKTPTQVQAELGISKFNLKPFLKRQLVKCLNPEGNKGKLYVLTNKAAGLLGLPRPKIKKDVDYNLLGQIVGSPKQNYVVLKTLFLNSNKYTSEEIRLKSKSLNPCLSRISTKTVLANLIDIGLVETELNFELRTIFRGRPIYGKRKRRHYWSTEKGMVLASEIFCVRQ